MNVLIFGSANIDHVYQLPHLVRAGETISSAHYARNAGGKGFNQAIALAKSGVQAHFAGAIGPDGAFLREMLNAHGVNTAHLQTLDVPTGHAIIQVDGQGQNAIVLYGGANEAVTEDQIDAVLADFAPGDWLLLQNEISCGAYLLEKAAQRGLHVALNPSPFAENLRNWPLGHVSLFLLNEVEGRDMTGYTAPDDILDEMQELYPEARIVLTLGEDGAAYAHGNVRIYTDAIPADAADTTAAGDTFTGYFLQGLMSGKEMAGVLHMAAQAASIAVSRPGAAQSIPTMDEVAAALHGEG